MSLKSEKSVLQTATGIECIPQNYFGQALKELRKEKDLTQEEAARLAGIEQTQWSAYELGKNKPNLDTIITMATGLKFNPLELVTRTLIKSKYFSSIKDVPFNLKQRNAVSVPKKKNLQMQE